MVCFHFKHSLQGREWERRNGFTSFTASKIKKRAGPSSAPSRRQFFQKPQTAFRLRWLDYRQHNGGRGRPGSLCFFHGRFHFPSVEGSALLASCGSRESV